MCTCSTGDETDVPWASLTPSFMLLTPPVSCSRLRVCLAEPLEHGVSPDASYLLFSYLLGFKNGTNPASSAFSPRAVTGLLLLAASPCGHLLTLFTALEELGWY